MKLSQWSSIVFLALLSSTALAGWNDRDNSSSNRSWFWRRPAPPPSHQQGGCNPWPGWWNDRSPDGSSCSSYTPPQKRK